MTLQRILGKAMHLVADDQACSDAVALCASDWSGPWDHQSVIERVCAGPVRQISRSVWARAPHLKEGLIRLSAHVTPRYPGRRTALLSEVAVAAITAFEIAESKGTRYEAEVAYLREIAAAADVLLAIQVLGRSARSARVFEWSVWGETLPDWLSRNSIAHIYLRPRAPSLHEEVIGGRAALLLRVVGPREIGMVASSGGFQ